MLHVWFKDSENKEARLKELRSYKRGFEELKRILEQEYKKKPSVREYAPGWEYKQVAVNEYNAALENLIKLLDID